MLSFLKDLFNKTPPKSSPIEEQELQTVVKDNVLAYLYDLEKQNWFEGLCQRIHESDNPKALISKKLDSLSGDKKFELLTFPTKEIPVTHYVEWLLRDRKKNGLILESLINGLSKEQVFEIDKILEKDNPKNDSASRAAVRR